MAMSAAKQSGGCCKVVAINRKPWWTWFLTRGMIDSTISAWEVTTGSLYEYVGPWGASGAGIKTLHRLVGGSGGGAGFSDGEQAPFLGVPRTYS